MAECCEAVDFDDLLQLVSDLWLDIKQTEKEFSYKFEKMGEAVSWLAEDKISNAVPRRRTN